MEIKVGDYVIANKKNNHAGSIFKCIKERPVYIGNGYEFIKSKKYAFPIMKPNNGKYYLFEDWTVIKIIYCEECNGEKECDE